MIYQYEMACKEAGMSEEEIKEIRRVFDADYKRLKRQKESRMTNGFIRVSIEAYCEGSDESVTMDIPSDYDLEADFLHKCDLERLQAILSELPEADRVFILDYFEDTSKGCLVRLAEKYDMKDYQVRDRKNRLILLLKNKFFEEI